MWGLLALSVLIVVVNLVAPDKGGLGGLLGIGGRPITFVATLALMAAQLALAGYLIKKRWDGIFIDERNRVSLARFQLVLWTAVLVGGLMSAGLSNAALGFEEPLRIEIPASVWSLLGLGAFSLGGATLLLQRKMELVMPTTAASSAVAERVKAHQHLDDLPFFRGVVLFKASARDARWTDLIRGDQADGDYVDIAKVQKLAFTAMLITIYAMGLYETFEGLGRIKAFPRVDDGFVALLGLSHVAYVASKSITRRAAG